MSSLSEVYPDQKSLKGTVITSICLAIALFAALAGLSWWAHRVTTELRRAGSLRSSTPGSVVFEQDAGIGATTPETFSLVQYGRKQRPIRSFISTKASGLSPIFGMDAIESGKIKVRCPSLLQGPRTGNYDRDVCPICTDTYCSSDTVRLLLCGHFFHPSCIDPWLLSKAKTCPMWCVIYDEHTFRIHSTMLTGLQQGESRRACHTD